MLISNLNRRIWKLAEAAEKERACDYWIEKNHKVFNVFPDVCMLTLDFVSLPQKEGNEALTPVFLEKNQTEFNGIHTICL